MRKFLPLLLVIFAVSAFQRLAAAERESTKAERADKAAPFEFKDGDRVVFLGDTFIEREQTEGYIETRLTQRLQGKHVIFRNVGWSADTVLGESRAGFDAPEKGFDRLKEQLALAKPTVAVLGYGMASSFAGQAGIDKFKADMKTLMDTIEASSKEQGVRFIILSPIFHENLGAPLPDPTKHNGELRLYADALKEIASARKAHFIPLFDLTKNIQSSEPKLTDNGIHPSPYGYWRIAGLILQGLNFEPNILKFGVTKRGALRNGSLGIAASNVQVKDDSIQFLAEDQYLPEIPAPIDAKAMGVNGATMQFFGLKPGNYELTVDSVPVATFSAMEWAQAKQIRSGPVYNQLEQLRQTIIKKNELFFHRWRPQNQTYLFGFRKYEQGQNAKEIPMFDPLIAEQEKVIDGLKELKKRSYRVAVAAAGDPKHKVTATPVAAKPETSGSVVPPPSKPQPLPEFQHDPNLEITLFAENPELAKPIHMNFDPQGRLWVASSSVYPQIMPGQEANDKILVLEDTDNDGKADKSTVFADGLLIPTGVEFGNGGAYVANSTELLFYKDNDGDGKADEKRVVLSGFGTEDTHHILHSLRWGHDGQLYMNQSIYIHSHIETPHGVVRLNSGGIFNFRPDTMELGIHMKGLVNSWGHHFDKFGQSFATDGAGGEGINWVVPQAMYVTYAGARRILNSVSPGSYPKFCGLEVVESEHFPQDWQGTMVTADFRAHRVVRFGISDVDSGYITKELPDVMRSTNVTFRPIDVKVGPDGALYIADWSNPIIQHGEVDFRDPRRDHEHGRIWRVAYKGREPLKKVDLIKASNNDLLGNLLSNNGHLRQQSRRILTERGTEKISSDLASWTKAQTTEQGKLEALWMYQSLDVVQPNLLKEVLAAKDGRIRAGAVRVLSFWAPRIENPLDLYGKLVGDEFPRVRLEAVRGVAKIPDARSAELVLSALEKPMDRFLDYAIWLSINDLAQPWIEAVKSGKWNAEGKEKQLEFALRSIEPAAASSVLASVLGDKPLPKDGGGPWIELIGKAGNQELMGRLLKEVLGGQLGNGALAKSLNVLAEAARVRNVRPAGNLQAIEPLLDHQNIDVRTAAARLTGAWKLQGSTSKLIQTAGSNSAPAPLRDAAFASLREIGGKEAVEGLAKMAAAGQELAVRQRAVKALAPLDLNTALPLAIEVLSETEKENEALDLWRSLLSNKGAAPALAQALPKGGLPENMARTGLRVAREGGRNEPNLVLALARSIEGEGDSKTLNPAELQQLVAFIQKEGNPTRGEAIYRRMELGCVSCHSIGGVGPRVGPDMTSIGASAPIDYLIESVQFPNRKIKEGFHAINVETTDDQELSGILARETDDSVVILDASNRENPIPKNKIRKKTIGGSLMPAGLVDALSHQEQADLYRFLAELGKPGPFDASKGNVARLWHVTPRTLDIAQFTDAKVLQMPLTDRIWAPSMTFVDGRLPKSELQDAVNRMKNRNPNAVYAIARFDVSKAGPVTLQFENLDKAFIWIDGKEVKAGQEVKVELAAGTHQIAVRIDSASLPEFIRVKTSDGTFLTN
ncbi:MAG: PVC-type heme-binding CxxCH protein [Verrucomicrobiales bacterium]